MQHDFPSILKAARKKKKLTMFEVAEQTGIPMPIYKMIEAGRLTPDNEKLKVMCEFFALDWKH